MNYSLMNHTNGLSTYVTVLYTIVFIIRKVQTIRIACSLSNINVFGNKRVNLRELEEFILYIHAHTYVITCLFLKEN